MLLAALCAAAATVLFLGPPRRPPDLPRAGPPSAAPFAASSARHDPGAARAGGAPSAAGAASAASAARLRLRAGAAAGVALACGLLLPAGWALVAAPVGAALAWWRSGAWETSAQRRRRERLERGLPLVVDLLVAALASGASPDDALARVLEVTDEPLRGELAVFVSSLRLGADPLAVWSAMAAHPQLGRLGTSLRRAAESGAPVAAALDRLARDLRARGAAEVAARVRQVEVRAAVPLGLCLLPAFVLMGVVPLVAGASLGLVAPR
jgi:Flp pilus assembly protein TadB